MHEKPFYENCRIDPALKNSFNKIGKPDPGPFKPDPFQLEALDRIKDGDVLVSAPTGAGKTWIAIQAIKRNLKSQDMVCVTSQSPLELTLPGIFNSVRSRFMRDSYG